MAKTTPIRKVLVSKSKLRGLVADGLGALDAGHRTAIEVDLRPAFADSLEIDENLRKGRENENRWDYLLGHGEIDCVVGLEPHSATNKEVTVVIKKRQMALEHIRSHLADGMYIRAWFWVASGKVDFVPMEKATNRLNNNGITFVGRQLLTRHVEALRTKKSKKV